MGPLFRREELMLPGGGRAEGRCRRETPVIEARALSPAFVVSNVRKRKR